MQRCRETFRAGIINAAFFLGYWFGWHLHAAIFHAGHALFLRRRYSHFALMIARAYTDDSETRGQCG
jgi:hypothetical protein